jgi:adenylate cyclase
MIKKIKIYFLHIWYSILFWAIALMLWSLFRFYGIATLEGITVSSNFSELMKVENLLRLFLFSGIIFGFVLGNIEYFFEKYVSNKIAIGLRILCKVALYLFSMIVISTFAKYLAKVRFDLDLAINPSHLWEDKTFFVTIIYVLLVAIVQSFIKIANEKFGKGVFLKILLGKYKKPKEEKRIFMFLDLKASTTIAESLGHFKYSQFIQDCFYDLNDIVPKYSAEIYQYVGDEAVLTWPYTKGLADNNCVALFFEFENLLKDKAPYYKEKYGQVPEFKAGLHGGKLMVAEVGVVKKELAFHGDVINTSARIQGECNKYDVSILISEQLKDDLKDISYDVNHIGNVLLKGKHDTLNIFTLAEPKF